MKTVVKTEQVVHLWANKSQDHARNSNGSVYFDGDTIYSYGSHFPMARHYKAGGREFILVNKDGYSSTTSGHQSMTKRAIHN